ncbi:Cpk34p [Trebouxia sp. C0010 RCD-2024]
MTYLQGKLYVYKLEVALLGEGSYGQVRKATRVATQDIFACKTMETTEQPLRESEREEAMLQQMAWSKHAVKLQETIKTPTHVHLIMEYCAGGDLFERIVREGRLPSSAAARILKSMAEFANDCLSTGIYHLDIKPDNVLLVSSDPDSDIKFADFGLARRQQDCQPGAGKYGTLGYMAPEVQKNGHYSHLAEMYSVGGVLYAMLCGEVHIGLDDWGEISSYTTHVQSLAGFTLLICAVSDAEKHDAWDVQAKIPALNVGAVVYKPLESSKHWEALDPEAKIILRKLLDHDPAQRLTADQVLQESWLYAAQGLPHTPAEVNNPQTATSEGMKGAGEHQASPLQTRALCDDIAGRDDNPQMMPLDDAGPSSPPAENNDEVARCHNMGVVEMDQQAPPSQQPYLAPHHGAIAAPQVTDGTESTASLHDRLAELQAKVNQQRQDVELETARRMAAEATLASITAQRDASCADCAQLRSQLNTLQNELHTAQARMNDQQGCRAPEGQSPGQGCEGQPSGVGDVPLGFAAAEHKPGSCAMHLQTTYNGVGFVSVFHAALLLQWYLT